MIKAADIEMELTEGERYLASGNLELARAKFKLAISLLARFLKGTEIAGKIGGPVAGITLAELVDALNDGLDHPILNVVIGGLVGYAAGTKGAAVVADSLAPLWVRAHNGLGDVAHAEGQDSEARRHYGAALKAVPDAPITRQKLAVVT